MEFLDVPLFDDDIFKMLVRLSINLLVAFLVVGVCYRKNAKNNSFVFAFFLLNIMVFFICFAMKKLELELGMALGLFAIFAIIRYRTDTIPVKEMTYLFVLVGVAVINALSNKKTSYIELATSNAVIVGSTFLLEHLVTRPKKLSKHSIVYDKLELLNPDRRTELLSDIENRIGIRPEKVSISKIDLDKNIANLTIATDLLRDRESEFTSPKADS